MFSPQPTQPIGMQPLIPDTPLPKPQMNEDESCLPWALSQIRGATVSVLRLEVPTTPDDIVVNDGSVPEANTKNNVFKITKPPETPATPPQ